jgi:predicted transcriptional regulator
MTDSITQDFLNTYNRLDDILRSRLGADQRVSHAKLIDKLAKADPVVRSAASRLHAFRALRNAVVHINPEGEAAAIATPLERVVTEYKQLVLYVETPPRALDTIAIREVFSTQWTDCVASTVAHMLQHSFRLLPIIQDGILEGVFTESTLWESMTEQKGHLSIDPQSKFSDWRVQCGFDPCPLGVVLLDQDVTIHDVEELFQSRFIRNEFTTAVLLTSTGSPDEPLLGLITAHDLPSANPRASAALLERLRGRTPV